MMVFMEVDRSAQFGMETVDQLLFNPGNIAESCHQSDWQKVFTDQTTIINYKKHLD